jgi:hypothetical protein
MQYPALTTSPGYLPPTGGNLLGRLEVLGPGTAAQVQEQRWRKDWQAMLLIERRSILRRGFARLD